MIEKKQVRLLFLDFDGVLINAESLRQDSIEAHPECVAALNRIVASTGALVVVTSAWRRGRSLAELRWLLKAWDVKATVIGKTPYLDGKSKSDEIEFWLKANSDRFPSVESIAILDDANMNGLSEFLVKTEFCPGLTEADADRAIAMLQGDAANDKGRAAAHRAE
jgi:HAD domain in Swiss Army Knife RNA repair proteins